MLHTHSFIYNQRCIMFFSQHFSFPCQYHSTNAPYSFNHVPPTLYNVFLPALQLPLLVSFHQCSILMLSSITDGYVVLVIDCIVKWHTYTSRIFCRKYKILPEPASLINKDVKLFYIEFKFEVRVNYILVRNFPM